MPERILINEQLGLIEVHSFGDISTADLANSVAAVKKARATTFWHQRPESSVQN